MIIIITLSANLVIVANVLADFALLLEVKFMFKMHVAYFHSG